MKNLHYLIIFSFMFVSCNNEERFIETKTNSIENKDAVLQINYESALKEILSPDACNLLLSYISSHEQINKESFEQLRNDFSRLSNSDKEFF